MAKTTKLLPPVHPGEILLEDFMKPLRLTVNKLVIDLQVPATRIGEIVHQRRRITFGHSSASGPLLQEQS